MYDQEEFNLWIDKLVDDVIKKNVMLKNTLSQLPKSSLNKYEKFSPKNNLDASKKQHKNLELKQRLTAEISQLTKADLDSDYSFKAKNDLNKLSSKVKKDSSEIIKSEIIKSDPPSSLQKTVDTSFSIAYELKNLGFIFGNYAGELYLYNEDSGTFNHLPSEGDVSLLSLVVNTESIPGSKFAVNTTILKSLKKILTYVNYFSVSLDETDENLVNLRNGVLDLRNLKLKKHSPHYHFRYCINANYVENPQFSTVTENFLSHLTQNDEQYYTSFMQLTGIMISNVRSLQLGGFLIGPPACGKSVFGKFISKLFPFQAVYSATLDTFAKNTELHFLNQAHITICADLEAGIISKKSAAVIKQIISGDRIAIRQLYHNSKEILPKTFILFLGNSIPVVEDAPDAFERRFIAIQTGATIPPEERNANILNYLLDDCDAIVSSALHHLHLVLTNKSPLLQGNISFRAQAPDINTTLYKWFTSAYDYSPGSQTPISCVYEQFLNSINGTEHITLTSFAMRLRKLFPDCKSEHKINNQRVIKNYALKTAD